MSSGKTTQSGKAAEEWMMSRLRKRGLIVSHVDDFFDIVAIRRDDLSQIFYIDCKSLVDDNNYPIRPEKIIDIVWYAFMVDDGHDGYNVAFVLGSDIKANAPFNGSGISSRSGFFSARKDNWHVITGEQIIADEYVITCDSVLPFENSRAA